MKIAAIYVLFNPEFNLLNKSLKKTICQVDKIYLIDNSEIYIDDLDSIINIDKIEYIKLDSNKGIAFALNLGCNLALKDGYLWALTLDQDSIIPDNMVDNFLDFICSNKDKRIGIIAPVFSEFNAEHKQIKREIAKVSSVITSGSIMSLEAFSEIKGFKEQLFIDSVDREFCLNLTINNYAIYQMKNIVLQHNLGNNAYAVKLMGRYLCYITNHNYIRRYYIVRNTLWVSNHYRSFLPDEAKRKVRTIYTDLIKVIFFEKDKLRKIHSSWLGWRDYRKNIMGRYRYNF